MNKLLLLIVLSLFCFHVNADNLRIPMAGNGDGKYLNNSVQLLKNAAYAANLKSVLSTGDDTAIRIKSIDFGDELYTYNSFTIEYTNPQSLEGDAYFDLYLEDTAKPIGSITVERTGEGEFREVVAQLSKCIIGKHDIYIRWRGHNATIRSFGADKLDALSIVPAVRSYSVKTFKFSKGVLKNIEGVHNLKMLWKNQNAVVKAVYLDKIDVTSIDHTKNNWLKISNRQGGFEICSEYPIGKIELYSLSGLKVYDSISFSCFENISVRSGSYILKVERDNKEIVIRKILVW